MPDHEHTPPPEVAAAAKIVDGWLRGRPPMPKNFWDMTPQERYAAEHGAADAKDPWRDFSRTLTRNEAGAVVQQGTRAATPNAVRVDDATYNRMTYPERVAYAAQFAQR